MTPTSCRRTGRAFVVALTASLALVSSAAGATLLPSAATSFTAANVGAMVLTLPGGTPSISCGSFLWNSGTKAAGAASASFAPSWSGCTTTIISSRPASITAQPGCPWTLDLAPATFTPATGLTTLIQLSTCGSTIIDIPSFNHCRLTIPQQVATTGVSAQNRTVGDAGNAPATGAPAGARVVLSSAQLTNVASQACAGIPPTTTLSIGSTLYAAGIWAG